MRLAARRVLVVSPCQEDGSFVAEALKHLGGEVVQVDGPAAVLELAGTCCFLLVLLDLDCDPQWPDTVQALQAVAPGTAVVVYSRLPDERRWIEALDVGATDYMAKPFRAGGSSLGMAEHSEPRGGHPRWWFRSPASIRTLE